MTAQNTLLTDAVKKGIRSFYKGTCQYCGQGGATHVEHIIARAKGGSDTLGNTTLACSTCNTRKSTVDLDPMFLAIAHARAKQHAPAILKLLTKSAQRNRAASRALYTTSRRCGDANGQTALPAAKLRDFIIDYDRSMAGAGCVHWPTFTKRYRLSQGHLRRIAQGKYRAEEVAAFRMEQAALVRPSP